MKRITPLEEYEFEPCLTVAVGCATGRHILLTADMGCHSDGYMTLNDANRIIRQYCNIKRRVNYKRGERPKLKELHIGNEGAIVCVLGHFVFVKNDTYYSYFDNENDDVVAVWELKK